MEKLQKNTERSIIFLFLNLLSVKALSLILKEKLGGYIEMYLHQIMHKKLKMI